MRFSQREIRELLFAWFMISLAFAILFSGGLQLFSSTNLFIVSFLISALTAGIGFLFHELMHKYMAQKFRLWAEFRAYPSMLWLAVLFSFFGFIIAAPGGVYIGGHMTRERNGKISLAGPATNMVLAAIFLVPLLFLVNQGITEGILFMFLRYGLVINSLLAAFNLIPISPFDGKKILAWNGTAYTIAVIIAIVLFGASFFV